jgi:hypothetical protein
MHWIGNSIGSTLLAGQDGIGFVPFLTGKEWLGSFGVEGMVMIALLGLLGGILYLRRRCKRGTRPASMAEALVLTQPEEHECFPFRIP